MDTVFLAVIAFLVCLFIQYCLAPLVRIIRFRQALSHVPVPEPPHWLLGHLPVVVTKAHEEELYERWTRDGTRIIRLDMVAVQEISLLHPEPASFIFKTAEPKAKESAYSFLDPWLGNGLLVSTGTRWARDRRLLTRGFHFGILRGYLPVYREAAAVMLEQWASKASCHGDQQAINVSRSCKFLTLDVILRCIMSYESHCQTDDAHEDIVEYVQAVLGMTKCLLERYFSPLQYPDFLFALSSNGRRFFRLKNNCHRVSRDIIAKRRAVLADLTDLSEVEELAKKKSSRRYLDFLDILLTVQDEDGQGLSDKEIQEQVDTFLFEGHDTTASALQWTLFYLAQNPDLQEKCRQEVKSTLDKSGDVSYDQLGRLNYLTQFIKESIRLCSPVPFIGRNLTKPSTIEGYHLPAGTPVTLAIFAIHRHPDAWDKPLEFNPDRFSPENSANRHPYTFVPFSAGPRNCIGQAMAMEEMKTVLSYVLLRFRLTIPDGYVKPKINTELVTRSLPDIEIYAHAI